MVCIAGRLTAAPVRRAGEGVVMRRFPCLRGAGAGVSKSEAVAPWQEIAAAWGREAACSFLDSSPLVLVMLDAALCQFDGDSGGTQHPTSIC